MACSRRGFLKSLAVIGAGTAVGQASASTSSPLSANAVGVLVDTTKCIGCRRCEYACQEAADFRPPDIESFEDKSVFATFRRPHPRSHTVINRFREEREGQSAVYNKFNCLHCVHPACVSSCIVSAYAKTPEGPVVYDAHRCMGCRYCMVACPFEIPSYEYDNALTPEIRKCNLCAHLVPEKQAAPACVKICPAEVMTYGPRQELLTLAHERIRRRPDIYVNHVYGEHEVGGTSWLYLSSLPFEQIGLPKLDQTAPPQLTETIQHGVFKNFLPPLMWYGLLGTIMWLTRSTIPTEHEPDEKVHAVAERSAELEVAEV